MERVAGVGDTLAGVLDVVDADADVAESAILLAVAIVDCVVVVLFGTCCGVSRVCLVVYNGLNSP